MWTHFCSWRRDRRDADAKEPGVAGPIAAPFGLGSGPGPPRSSVPSWKGNEGCTEISGACWRDLGGQGCHAEVAYGIDEAGSQTRRVLNRTAEQSCPFAQALERQEICTQAEISPDAGLPDL